MNYSNLASNFAHAYYFHAPDDAWQYEENPPLSRFPFGQPCPFIWNGVAWVRWYGQKFTDEEIKLYTDISDAFIV